MHRRLGTGLLILFFLVSIRLTAAPVEFFKLCVYERGTSINLIWETALEVNNAYFLIERSSDQENFKVIGQVQGNGTVFEKNHYEFEDNDPIEGLSYYRLKQVDLNGEFSYSEIVEVSNYMKIEASKLQLFPNPAPPEEIVLLISPDENSDDVQLDLQVFSLDGKLLSSGNIDHTGTHHLYPFLKDLHNGSYLLKLLSSDGKSRNSILMIQR